LNGGLINLGGESFFTVDISSSHLLTNFLAFHNPKNPQEIYCFVFVLLRLIILVLSSFKIKKLLPLWVHHLEGFHLHLHLHLEVTAFILSNGVHSSALVGIKAQIS